jgi:hypothetical protein
MFDEPQDPMTRPFKMQIACTVAGLAGCMLAASMAQAQPQAPASTQAPTPAATQEKDAATPYPGVVTAVNTEPRYAPSDLARAFSYMDGNKDGKVSREEAARFKNVAKHFDAADTDRDRSLSLDEFSSAMNRPKSP